MKIDVPVELKDVEPHIKVFFDAMLYKLAQNSHKGAWENLKADEAYHKLMAECQELNEALTDLRNTVEIILECADVGNFALILANIAVRDAGKE